MVSYDISDERVRGKVRRLLRRYGLSFVSRSTYAGRISWSRILFLSEKVSRVIGDRDVVAFIPVQNVDFERALIVSKGKVSGYEVQVVVAGKDI